MIRHALAEMFQREEIHEEAFPTTPVTITEVRVSPDLKSATVFCSALGKDVFDEEVAQLNAISGAIRQVLGRKITMKYTPSLKFLPDETFEEAARINALLKETRRVD
ncbi:ribosome-binding factor A [Parvularcula bermudensis HTCC2503]|uniref:Ribosome-binding factor A n=1 Tax=Parvularcula bermudensis (strain ATCC BAA-594 / HTCC2503 / KCTC 12087) TaxID=314260 RepID=E0TFQ7_PARBH|nr:ribosome-binding factor A [Parvularcula bermudensis HTCC2503]